MQDKLLKPIIINKEFSLLKSKNTNYGYLFIKKILTKIAVTLTILEGYFL